MFSRCVRVEMQTGTRERWWCFHLQFLLIEEYLAVLDDLNELKWSDNIVKDLLICMGSWLPVMGRQILVESLNSGIFCLALILMIIIWTCFFVFFNKY